jgi:DNA/RNA endonuclease YhcR with UshA esterase domain
MRFLATSFSLAIVIGMSAVCSARDTSPGACVAFDEASKHVGSTQCVRGTVQHVEEGGKGVTFLNFCPVAKTCPFTVVVFSCDLKKMGDVRQLEGKQIEIKGTVQDYEGRTEIILRRYQQLGEGAFLLFPQVPTDYDVERKGHASAGKFSHPKAAKKTETKKGDPMSIEEPDEP